MRRLAVLAVLALGACGGGDGGTRYSAEVRKNFLEQCTASGGAEDVCRCSLEKIEARFTEKEFRQVEVKAAAGGDLPDEIREAVTDCAGR